MSREGRAERKRQMHAQKKTKGKHVDKGKNKRERIETELRQR